MGETVFNGKWICAHESVMEQNNSQNIHILIRRDLLIKQPHKKTIIRITADDYYKLYINGRFVGQGPAPGYPFAYYYNEYDISSFITSGVNSIFLDVYYQGLVNRVWCSADARQGMIADLFQDGICICCTDSDWEYTIDHSYVGNRITGYLTQFLEDRDSRISPIGWQPVCVKAHDYKFSSGAVKALETYLERPPVAQQRGNCLFYDFGREITGSLILSAKGKSGQQLRILCGEECHPDGRVRYEMRCNCTYEEYWTLDDGENRIEQYDYKAFRYVEIMADERLELDAIQIECRIRHYPFPVSACTLETSDTVLQSVFNLCKDTVKIGSQEVFVDCPSREKGQYTGDLVITGSAHLWLTGDESLLRKAINDMVHSLCLAEGMLAVTPCSFSQEIADYSLQFPLVVWRCYTYTADREFLYEMLSPCEQVIDYFSRYRRHDGLLEQVDKKWNLVDWPANLRDGYDFPLTEPIGPGCHNVINAFYIGCIKTVEQIKRELGLPYDDVSSRLTDTFNRCFFRPETGCYTDSETSDHSSLHSNCVPVFYGLHPPESRDSIGKLLIDKGLCCGVYMAFFYLKALASLDLHQAVYELITSKGENSWYNMIREGATTCFEAWGKDKKFNTSLCHPWASAPIPVLIEDLLGVRIDPASKEYTITPRLPESLSFLKIQIPVLGENIEFVYNRQ